jgi:hypothetical protein
MEYKKVEKIEDLKRGDIVRSISGNVYVVTANYGTHATAVNTIDVSNPIEWEVLVSGTQTLPAEEQECSHPSWAIKYIGGAEMCSKCGKVWG